MKNKTLLFLLLLFTGVLSTSSQLRYGFRFGGDFAASRLKNVPGYSIKNGSGFAGGLMLEYQFEKFGFAPDIAVTYGRHNSRLKPKEGEPFSYGRNFIDIPIRLKYKFWLKSTKDLFAPMIYTGPVFSCRLGHDKEEILQTKGFQPGWDVGVGFDAINFIQITAGYRFGLGNAVKNFADVPDAVLKTDGWNLSVNIIFDF